MRQALQGASFLNPRHFRPSYVATKLMRNIEKLFKEEDEEEKLGRYPIQHPYKIFRKTLCPFDEVSCLH